MESIKGYEGMYEISNYGRVKSLARTIIYSNGAVHKVDEKIKNARKNPDGYRRASLSKGSIKENYSIHRLVAEHFIPNPNNLEQVNHITGDKERNEAWNLEWCTESDNMKHAHKTGLIKYCKGERHKWSKLTATDIENILHLLNTTKLYQWEIAEKFGVSHSVISRIKDGKRWGSTTGICLRG
jgi:hypothetical protein